MLTIFYLYKVLCSFWPKLLFCLWVVNCLQFFIFTRFFAVLTRSFREKTGCELLTIFYLYKVLCSFSKVITSPNELWIAYNFLSLQGSLQCAYEIINKLGCCELLTIFYLYKVLCSYCKNQALNTFVVNCLQFFIFTRFFAVRLLVRWRLGLLWIAYNFLSLQGSLQ